MFNCCYEKIQPILKPHLKPYDHELYKFNGKSIRPWGVIKLLLQLKDADNYVIKDIEFVVVDYFSSYNAILGKNTI